jgi:RNA polymerase sigma-70 factor (ECF subfamily)
MSKQLTPALRPIAPYRPIPKLSRTNVEFGDRRPINLPRESAQLNNVPSRRNSYHEPFEKTSKVAESRLEEFGTASPEITHLLIEWNKGGREALDKMLPLVERELRRLAHSYIRREHRQHTLQTTGLVNEAFLRLVDQKKTRWQNRAHFFGIAAQIMRRILLNYARDQQRQKRGGKSIHVSFSEATSISYMRAKELIALDEALARLALLDQRRSQVVELRYFGGLNVQEVAEVLKISTVTVMRDWKFAKAWLRRELESDKESTR